MSRIKNSGRMYIVREGVHAGKTVFAMNSAQHEEIRRAGKIAATVTENVTTADLFGNNVTQQTKTVLFNPQHLKLIGFFD